VLARFAEWGGPVPAYAGRPAQSSPAVGSSKRHAKEQAKVIAAALGTAEAAGAGAPAANETSRARRG
jgi:hypothetical protein